MRALVNASLVALLALPAAAADHRPVTETAAGTTFGPYAYDGAGNIKSIGSEPGFVEHFEYDRAGRLITSVMAPGTQEFRYDAFGNRTFSSTAGSMPRCNSGADCDDHPGVDPLTNHISTATYDAAGNVTQYADRHYFYDPAGMMTRQTNGAIDLQYVYTADDERIAVYRGGGWEFSLRDPQSHVIRVFKAADGPNGLASKDWTRDQDYIFAGGSLLVGENAVAGRLHYHHDHLGTTRLITDDYGHKVGEYEYYAFGTDPDSHRDPDAYKERLGFTGHEVDASTGDLHVLNYMHARYYDGAVGRFMSVDPVIEMKKALRRPQMWNGYAYVSNNPLNATDPDGRSEFRLDNQLGREQLAIVNGDMTMDQYIDTQAVRFNAAMTAYSIVEGFGALRSLIGLIRGVSGLARGSIGLDAAIARGAIREGGALSRIVGGIEAGFKSGAPKSAEAALEVVAKSAEAAGMKPGAMVKATDGAKYVLQNVGDVKTFIYKTGEVIVKKGDDILVRLIPK